ncbi:MAG: hypothetical protein ACE5I1_18285 [bacterium]
MDPLTLTAAIAAILGFIYLVFIGQKNIFEYLRERKKKKTEPEEISKITPVVSDTSSTIPQNLPHRGDFVGREKEKKQVHEALKSRSFITMIDGIGGIGKTSLALEVLHECLAACQNSELDANEFQAFEAFIWTSARYHPLGLSDVLDTVARTLEYPFITQLSLDEKRHEVIKRLREKSCLLIVDNFETVTDDALSDFIQNLPEPSKCLVSSRVQSLRQACAVSIRGLDHEEARQLIANEGSRLGLDLTPLAARPWRFAGRLARSSSAASLSTACSMPVPIIFSFITVANTTRSTFATPLQIALVFVGFVIFMDVFVVALLIEKSFEMFASFLGTWLTFVLIFLSSYLTAYFRRRVTL